MSQDITFRPLGVGDLPTLHRWLNEPLVLTWYSKRASTLDEIKSKYGPRAGDDSPVKVYVICLDGQDVGMIQKYVLTQFPEYAATIGADPGWVGIDFFLGETSARSSGIGARAIERFVSEHVLDAGYAVCCSTPDTKNLRSAHALSRAGFRHMRTVLLPTGDSENLMVVGV
jgi:RimJ/RimL family protein N-acetyltransferase